MRVQIINPVNDFGMVPRALWRMPLPFAAKALAAYLFCLRDGAMPYVAEIEQTLGIGRDARRKAFAALEAAQVIEWKPERVRGKVVGKTLLLNPLAVVVTPRAPENQADGENHRPPEKPADGKTTPKGTENRSCSDVKSGDTEKGKEKRRRAAAARAVKAGRSASPHSAASRPSADRAKGSQAAKVRETVQTAARAVTGAKGAGERARAESPRPETSGVPFDRIAQGWDKARSCASLGLQWRHPVSGEFHPASEFDRVSA